MYFRCGLTERNADASRPPVSKTAGDVTEVAMNSTAREPEPVVES